MAPRSRKKTSGEFKSKTGVILSEHYCRKCVTNKNPKDFYQAVDFYLDRSGLMSVCKNCVTETFDMFFLQERTISKATLLTCRTLNIRYDEDTINSVTAQIARAEEKGKSAPPYMSLYLIRLATKLSRSDVIEDRMASPISLTFEEPAFVNLTDEDKEMLTNDVLWGEDISILDLEFLNRKFNEFKKTHVIQTAAEIELLKLVCFNLLDIEKSRQSGQDTASQIKQLRELFKSLTVSPDMENAAMSGNNLETYGLKIKYIEEHMPAELMEEEQKKRYADADGYERYYENFLRRPTINYNADLNNYMIVNEDGEEEDWSIKD